MATFGPGCGVFLVAFFASLTGVMAEQLDTDLIGVVVAAVCIGVLSIVIIVFMAYCCFRRIEYDRKPVLVRNDSESVSTGIAPRWAPNMVPSNRPVYSLPAEPVMYAVPANYYLGHYAPKFIDAEQMHYMHPYQYGYDARGGEGDDEEVHARRAQGYQEYLRQRDEQFRQHEELSRQHGEQSRQHGEQSRHHEGQLRQQEEQQHVHHQADVTNVTQVETNESQPNGQVSGDFSASSLNYRVIRKSHKHEKMPEWLRKDYDENEQSMDVEDDVSGTSSAGSTRQRISTGEGIPLTAVRAQVSPKDSVLDFDDDLHVARDFTIVDYVDPEQPRATSGAYEVEDDSQGYRITTHTTATSSTTGYHAQRLEADTSQASESSTYVPPASTSTPRAPPEVMEDIEDHYRMRRPGEGSAPDLPGSEGQAADVQF